MWEALVQFAQLCKDTPFRYTGTGSKLIYIAFTWVKNFGTVKQQWLLLPRITLRSSTQDLTFIELKAVEHLSLSLTLLTAVREFLGLGYHTCCPVSRHWKSASSWAFSLAISFKDLSEKGLTFFEHQVLGVKEFSFNYAYAQIVFLRRKEAKTILAFKTSWSYWCNEVQSKVWISGHLILWTLFSHVLHGSSLTIRINQRQLPDSRAACSYFCCSVPLPGAYRIGFW